MVLHLIYFSEYWFLLWVIFHMSTVVTRTHFKVPHINFTISTVHPHVHSISQLILTIILVPINI